MLVHQRVFVMLKPVDKKSGSIPILVQSTFSQNQQFWHLKSAQGPRCNSCPSTYVGVIGNDGKSWDIHGDSGEINGNNMDKPMDLTMNMIDKSSVQISTGPVKNMGIHNGNIWIHMGYNVVWIINFYYQISLLSWVNMGRNFNTCFLKTISTNRDIIE